MHPATVHTLSAPLHFHPRHARPMDVERSFGRVLCMLPFNFSPMAGAPVVYVSAHLALPHHPCRLALAGKINGQRGAHIHRHFHFSTFIPWLHRFVTRELLGRMFLEWVYNALGTAQATWAIWCWHITSESTLPESG